VRTVNRRRTHPDNTTTPSKTTTKIDVAGDQAAIRLLVVRIGLGLSPFINWCVTKQSTNLPDEKRMKDQTVTEITRRAMATEFAVVLPDHSGQHAESALIALELLDPIESRLSVYKPESEISKINVMAGNEPVRITEDVFEILSRAKELQRITAGAFDVTAGPLIECWGFMKRRGRKPTEQEVKNARELVRSDYLHLDKQQRTAFLERPGMKINLGGIGKGFAIDRIADSLDRAGVESYLIHGGKSTVRVKTSPQSEQEWSWRIGIEHPTRPGNRLTEIELRNGSVATSGSGKQFFHYRGQRQGHVIDPRTGYPSNQMLSISVQTETATDADAFSTACYVLGLKEYCEQARTSMATVSQCELAVWPHRAIAVVPSDRSGGVTVIELPGDETLLENETADQA
jgi:FAD:protein FMN transferase